MRVKHCRQPEKKSVASAASQQTAGSGLAASVSLFHPAAVAFSETVVRRNKDLPDDKERYATQVA
ncbi:MAG: hypothetical protein E6Q72_00705 [Pseudomonas sp.]|nr:MAG: hypothetical protein E6Q72_00705 [Pseudomonas sp.]